MMENYTESVDSGNIRYWLGISDQPAALLLYDKNAPLRTSSMCQFGRDQFGNVGGVCVFASPPLYSDPEVHQVKNWGKEIQRIVELQGDRHAFIGSLEDSVRLGDNPIYNDI